MIRMKSLFCFKNRKYIIVLTIIIFSYVVNALFFSHRTIYYSYNGITVTRIDKDNGEYYLIYGKYNYFNKGSASEFLSGGQLTDDGLMNAYLLFLPDKEVVIIRCVGMKNYVCKSIKGKFLSITDYPEKYYLDSILSNLRNNNGD